MFRTIRRNRAKRILIKKIENWKQWCLNRSSAHSNANIDICRMMLAEIVMLRGEFLPWGKYFHTGPCSFSYYSSEEDSINQELIDMGCGTMHDTLNYDLRVNRAMDFHTRGRDMWTPSVCYSSDFPRCSTCFPKGSPNTWEEMERKLVKDKKRAKKRNRK